MNIDELKQGDVLLFSPKKGSFISWAIAYLTNSNVSHAAMFYNEEDKTIIEEKPPQVAVNKADDSFKKRTIYVKRLKNGLTMTPVINQSKIYLNNEEPYDDVGLYMVGILLLYKKFTPDTPQQKIIIKILKKITSAITKYINEHEYPDKSPMVCSQFVAQCYAGAGNEYELIIKNGTLEAAIEPTESILDQVLNIVRSQKVRSTQPLLMATSDISIWEQESSEDLCKELQSVMTSKTQNTADELSDEFIDAVSQFSYIHHIVSLGVMKADPNLCEAHSFLQKLHDEENMFTFPADLMDHCTNLEQVGTI
jgi:hypothetical protein